MSYFLGLTVLPSGGRLRPSLDGISSALPTGLSVQDISATPFGDAVGGGAKRLALALTAGGTSTDLLGKGPARASQIDACKSCLEALFEAHGGLALVVHFFRGDVGKEAVSIGRTAKVSLKVLLETFPALGEDTRYVCTWRG